MPSPEDLWRQPLAAQLPERMRERGMSYRELSLRTYEIAAADRQKGLSHVYLVDIAKARARPTLHAIELIAAALQIDPEIFPDYRLSRLRAYLDQRHEPEALARFMELEEQLASEPTHGAVAEFVSTLHQKAVDTTET